MAVNSDESKESKSREEKPIESGFSESKSNEENTMEFKSNESKQENSTSNKSNRGNSNSNESKKTNPLLIGVIIVLGLIIVLLLTSPKTPVECPPSGSCVCPPSDSCVCDPCAPCVEPGDQELGVMYMYPPMCEGCDPSKIRKLAGEIGLNIDIYTNDAIPFSHIILTKGNASTIASAMNNYNIMVALCAAKYEKACDIMAEEPDKMRKCLSENGVSNETVVFYYSDECTQCKKAARWIRDLENESYEDYANESYKFLLINTDDKSVGTVVKKGCLSSFLNIPEGVPQYICVANAKSHTDTSQRTFNNLDIRDFAEECRGV